MQPNLDKAIAVLDDEMQRWTMPDETGSFRIHPENLFEVAAIAGSVEGRWLDDRRTVITLAGRICRIYQTTITIRTFLAGLAHRVEALNFSTQTKEKGFQVNPYGFDAEIDSPLREGGSVRLYVETCNGQPRIAQIQAYCFLIVRQDFHEVDIPNWLQRFPVPIGRGK